MTEENNVSETVVCPYCGNSGPLCAIGTTGAGYHSVGGVDCLRRQLAAAKAEIERLRVNQARLIRAGDALALWYEGGIPRAKYTIVYTGWEAARADAEGERRERL